MSRRSSQTVSAVLIAALVLLATPPDVRAQSTAANPSDGTAPAAAVRRASTGTRVMWTLIGTAAGFAIGAAIGFSKFDDARYAERKITTAAGAGAVAGGILGATLSRDAAPAFVPTRQPPFDPAAAARQFGLRAPVGAQRKSFADRHAGVTVGPRIRRAPGADLPSDHPGPRGPR